MYEYLGYQYGTEGSRYHIHFLADDATRKEIDAILLERHWSEFGLTKPVEPRRFYFIIYRSAPTLEVMEFFCNYETQQPV